MAREVNSTSVLPQKSDDNQPHTSSEPYGGFSAYDWSYKQHHPLPVPPPTVIPPLSYYYRPHRLEDIAPRDRISLIIALFFDFVYPLTPCIHKPSFMADLHSRREERDPLFFALVMSTVASTLVQVPRSYLPMERSVVRKLAQTCYEASRHITIASYDPPTSMHVVIRYLYVFPHIIHDHIHSLLTVTVSITFAKAMMPHSTRLSAKQLILLLRYACTRRPHMRGLTQLNARLGEELSGCFLMVRP